MERHAEAAVLEQRRTGDREAIALAIADWADLITTSLWDPARALAIATEAWAEFSDLEQTPAGVRLMDAIAWTYLGLDDAAGALPWFDRLLPIAERLGLLEATAAGILGRGESLLMMGRPREGMVLLRGAHQLAVAHDLATIELGARILMTYHEQWGEPAVGLALAREGLEIGRRRGSRRYGSWMVGNGCICALRTGDWDWAAALLDEWLALEPATISRAEFHGTGRSSARSGARTRRPTSLRRPGSGSRPGSPARSSGPTSCWPGRGPRSRAAVPTRSAGSGSARSSWRHLAPLVGPLLVRSALWAGDAPGATAALASLDASGCQGPALAADRLVARAGIDALEGRGPAALAGYREALRAYRKLGLAFDEAAAAVDMAVLLRSPERDAPDVVTAIARRPHDARAPRRAPIPRPPRRR